MCRPAGVTHFLTTIAGFRIVVNLRLETAATVKHVTAFIDQLRSDCKTVNDIETVKARIRKSYPNCTFPSELPNTATAHTIL